MSLLDAGFLGIIQGLTEFLPVSSSGHLVLFSQFLGTSKPFLVFEIVVHAGTLLAVVLAFWRDFTFLIASMKRLIEQPHRLAYLWRVDHGCHLLLSLMLSTLPVIVFALVLKDQIEGLFQSSALVGFMLIITGTVLFLSNRWQDASKPLTELSVTDALLIGVAQALAIFPGISRSGATIALGLAVGLHRQEAARFSFLLSVPAIFGALVFSFAALKKTAMLGIAPLGIGFLAAALVGFGAIHLLLDMIRKGKLIWFSYYTWFIGALVVIQSFL